MRQRPFPSTPYSLNYCQHRDVNYEYKLHGVTSDKTVIFIFTTAKNLRTHWSYFASHYIEDGGSQFLRNIRTFMPDQTASRSRRQSSNNISDLSEIFWCSKDMVKHFAVYGFRHGGEHCRSSASNIMLLL
jgi:hypothetical protein